MAKLGKPIEMPSYADLTADVGSIIKAQDAAYAKLDPNRIVRWGRGDGYAEYYVESFSPLVLRHIPYMDAWTVEGALIRGLREADVRAMLDNARAMRELFEARKRG